MEECLVRHGNAMREAGRTAGILQIGNVAAFGLRQFTIGNFALGKFIPAEYRNLARLSGSSGQVFNLVGIEHDGGIAASKLNPDLLDIAFLAAKRCGQWQWHWPCTGIDNTKEQRTKLRLSIGD